VPTELEEQHRVLSEVSHDLANQFHRTYYLIELLGEALPPGNATTGDLLGRLRETVEDIESMSRSALAFMRPIDLQFLRVRLEDLATSLRQHVGMRPIELKDDASAGRCEVDVDPARISEALGFLCRAAIADDNSEEPVTVELFGGDPVALRIRRAAGATKPAHIDLRLALTARIARLHGGALDIEDGEAASITLRLPVAAAEA
jgi:signal transduction histidine kinase